MIARILVVLALATGVAAFFLPVLSFELSHIGLGNDSVDMSMLQLSQGAKGLESALGGIEVPVDARSEVDSTLGKVQVAMMIPFAPTVLFLLIMIFGLKRFGRGLGVTSLLAGLLAIGGWALVNAAMAEAPAGQVELGFAMTLVLVGGGLGVLGGIVGIAAPQPRAG